VLSVLCVFCGEFPLSQGTSQADTIRIGVLKNGSYEIQTVPLETYVARVLTGEALPGSEPAALQTLAIAIRTYALGNRGKHRADGFDLCDQTHCQVMRSSTPINERAALATAGQVLLYKGQPATVFYSASCGGRTEKPSNVWPGADDPPYLPSQHDDGCEGAPEWSTELSIADLQRSLRAGGFSGVLRNVRIATRNESGRAARLTLDGMTPAEISGQDLRAVIGRTLGWQYLQSAAFELKRSGNAFRFAGHGNGHGVGLCVIGSTKLATAGETAPQILKRYFPGTTIGAVATTGPSLTGAPPERPPVSLPVRPAVATAPPPPVTPPPDMAISLPEDDEGARTMMTTLVRRERDELALALRISAPQRVTVHFHPTTEMFERITGRPWFTLGAVAGADLQFVPLAVLRDRGVLERTIRRQLVHLLIDTVLAERPVWVREGAAVHFAEAQDGPQSRVVCPQDVELTRPVSMGAYGDASRRARICFERQLASGKDWRDVR
jgi:stage II sporulation protein D (peptidoglycan lytic transglycosylase)